MGVVLRWCFRNRADTRTPSHTDLRPLDLALPVEKAGGLVRDAVAPHVRWRVVSEGPAAGAMHLTRRTRVFRFIDDVRLTFDPAPGGCRVHADSRSRVGSGDLGQNRRNILDLWAVVSKYVGETERGGTGE